MQFGDTKDNIYCILGINISRGSNISSSRRTVTPIQDVPNIGAHRAYLSKDRFVGVVFSVALFVGKKGFRRSPMKPAVLTETTDKYIKDNISNSRVPFCWVNVNKAVACWVV